MPTDIIETCYHCGEPIPSNCLLVAEIDGQPQAMCCPGCQAVAQLIAGAGLESFYRLRTSFNQRPEADSATGSYEIYNKPENCADFVEVIEPGWQRGRLLLGGISCAACTWLIETALLRDPGIRLANVNLAQQSLTIEWDSQRIALAEIFLRLSQLGYEPHPWQARRGAELIQQEQRRSLRQLAVAGLAMMQVGMFAIALHAGDLQGIELQYRGLLRWVSLLIATIVVLYSARSFFRNAWVSLRHGSLVMDLPVALAIGLAYSASALATVSNQGQVYFDSVAMFTFFLLLGRFLERRVRQRELLRQTDLQSLLPASCLRLDGQHWVTIASREIMPGDILYLKAGSTLPTDGVIVEGRGSINEASFTGEQLPREVAPGDPVTAGTLLLEGETRMRATTDTGNTRIAAMMRVIARAEQEKPRLARLADRVAAWFVAAILLITSAVAWYWYQQDPQQALWIALSVLVVSCPCALALATPAALANAVGGLRRRGVLLNGENTLEQINSTQRVLFDKTGTLTLGKLSLNRVLIVGTLSEPVCLARATALEQHSNHPIATAFNQYSSDELATNLRVQPGAGVSGQFAGEVIAIGKPGFVRSINPSLEQPPDSRGHWIALSSASQTLAWFELVDELRPEAESVVRTLQAQGLQVELLSGDSSDQVPLLAEKLGMDAWHGGCSPAQKLEYIQHLQGQGVVITMVGDGLNDAPVLAAADCSFAVNSATDLAKSRADAILLRQDLGAVLETFTMAQRCRRVVLQNMAWALGYNSCALPLAAMGLIPPWAAAIGMSLSSLLVVGNSLRLGR